MPGLNGSAAGRSVEAPTDLLPPVEDDGRQLRSVAVVLRRFTAIVAALAAKPCSNSFCGGKSPPWAGPPRDHGATGLNCGARLGLKTPRLPTLSRGAPGSLPTPLRGGAPVLARAAPPPVLQSHPLLPPRRPRASDFHYLIHYPIHRPLPNFRRFVFRRCADRTRPVEPARRP